MDCGATGRGDGAPAEPRRRYLLGFVVGWTVACSVLGALPLRATAAGGGPELAPLLRALDLAGYDPAERPPNVGAFTVEGRPVQLAGLQGRGVLLNFWATWCPECRPEMLTFDRLHRELAGEGLTVLGVNVREAPRAARQYARDLGLTFPIVLDRAGEPSAAYGMVGVPTTFLIGRDGRVVARAIGPRDWASPGARALIRALLAEQPPPSN